MTHYEPAPLLDNVVARQFAAPAVDRAKQKVRDAARRLAPPAKTWVTMADERVRETHEDADQQIIPGNLRYVLAKPFPGVGEELARIPGDESLSIANRANCRCQSLGVPEALRRSIHAGHTQVQGSRVRAQVYTRFNRAAESEYGTDLDRPARFMRGAVDEVAARTGGSARGT